MYVRAAETQPRRRRRRQASELAPVELRRPQSIRVEQVALERHAVPHDGARGALQRGASRVVQVDAAALEVAAKRQGDARGFRREPIGARIAFFLFLARRRLRSRSSRVGEPVRVSSRPLDRAQVPLVRLHEREVQASVGVERVHVRLQIDVGALRRAHPARVRVRVPAQLRDVHHGTHRVGDVVQVIDDVDAFPQPGAQVARDGLARRGRGRGQPREIFGRVQTAQAVHARARIVPGARVQKPRARSRRQRDSTRGNAKPSSRNPPAFGPNTRRAPQHRAGGSGRRAVVASVS